MTRAVLGVDVGGTFTDFVLVEGLRIRVFKTPSSPDDPSEAVLEGIRALQTPLDAEVVHGSTVATNALLERKGARTALLVTRGFEDLLEIGRQNRPALYDFLVDRSPSLTPPELRIGVPERIDSRGVPLVALSHDDAARVAAAARDGGAEAVAVSLLFSFLNPRHEAMLREAMEGLADGPFLSVSSDLVPEYREYERTSTTVVNAYVGPVVARYLRRLEVALGRRLRVVHSGGGSLSAGRAAGEPVRTLLSGPAAGVVGAFHLASRAGFDDAITFDMGGTSTDVSICPGRVQETGASSVGGYPITVPMIDIHTVGAGGGSIARLDPGGALLVGPASAGADPGPACYGRGEQVTVTDANLLLGRMDPDRFLGGRMALDVERSRFHMARLATQMGAGVAAVAEGVVRVANATMERALRAISLERGFDPRRFTLVAFGGAGPMHACALAEELRIPRVVAPPHSGVLSALGAALSDVVKDYSRSLLLTGDAVTPERVRAAFEPMERQATAELEAEGFAGRRLRLERLLDMRYAGQSYELTVPCPSLGPSLAGAAARRFHRAHRQRFGYSDPSQPVEVVTARLKAVGLSSPLWERAVEDGNEGFADGRAAASGGRGLAGDDAGEALVDERAVVFGGRERPTRCYDRERLVPGHAFPGPALVFQMDATTVVAPGWAARVDLHGNLVMEPSHA